MAVLPRAHARVQTLPGAASGRLSADGAQVVALAHAMPTGLQAAYAMADGVMVPVPVGTQTRWPLPWALAHTARSPQSVVLPQVP